MSDRFKHNGIAVFVVVALHALVIGLLWRLPAPAAMTDGESRLRLRFWPRESPIAAPVPFSAPPATSDTPRSPLPAAAHHLPSRPAASRTDDTIIPLPANTDTGTGGAADLLAQGVAWARVGDPMPDFGSDPLRQRRARLPGGERPGRFVMSRSVSPEQVVKFIGELFAGPGYDTDPCRRIRHNVDSLMTDLSDQGRERLGWELDEYTFRCMR
ncbi:hypothetical protein [Pseudoxanthomonas sp. PXM04]|uniref:hypothetical protein n=1 Tax=Pseudoxanthomonas sp. PXM04 TaxID=2769297 RepID=UPI00177CC652|nr:hypothetical protein [Pseudoxanthomonas sp. PXM04]MBD9377387.1 hypothetical protein [Pseudoxanthomonas sp. PXM04]